MGCKDHRRRSANGAIEASDGLLSFKYLFQGGVVPQMFGAGDAAGQDHKVERFVLTIFDQTVGDNFDTP
jgi:hypothetical protein